MFCSNYGTKLGEVNSNTTSKIPNHLQKNDFNKFGTFILDCFKNPTNNILEITKELTLHLFSYIFNFYMYYNFNILFSLLESITLFVSVFLSAFVFCIGNIIVLVILFNGFKELVKEDKVIGYVFSFFYLLSIFLSSYIALKSITSYYISSLTSFF